MPNPFIAEVSLNKSSAMVTTKLISNFFADQFPKDLNVNGVVVLTFPNAPISRRRQLVDLRGLQASQLEGGNEASFFTTVQLESIEGSSPAHDLNGHIAMVVPLMFALGIVF